MAIYTKKLESSFFFWLTLLFGVLPMGSSIFATSVDSAHTVIVRLDYSTQTIKGFYSFKEPLHISAAPVDFHKTGMLYIETVFSGDFGHIQLVSGLTGKKVLIARTIWAGRGGFDFPTDTLQVKYGLASTIVTPDTLFSHLRSDGPQSAAAMAWEKVQATDILSPLIDAPFVEVHILGHFYTVGLSDPTTAEWFIVAFNGFPAVDFSDPTLPVAESRCVNPCPDFADFNGDNRVGLDDFFLLADHFGLHQGDTGWDARYDSNFDQVIDLKDFFAFADDFGQIYSF